MKIDNVDIYTSTATSSRFLNLNFKDPHNQSSYIAKEILGLDADEILSRFYGIDLSNRKYYDLSLNSREVVFKIMLKPNRLFNQTYGGLRDEVYTLISASRTGEVELRFKEGSDIKAVISGFITKVESVNFTKSPEIQLTIKCDNGILKAFEEVDVNVSPLNLGNSLVEDLNSTSPHGFRFDAVFTGNIVNFYVKDQIVPNWKFEINLTGSPLGGFQTGDKLQFSSEANNQYLRLVRGVNVVHLIDRVLPGSIWPIMFPGPNNFILSDLVDWDFIKYYPAYWGI